MPRKILFCLVALIMLGQSLCAQDTLSSAAPVAKVKKNDSVKVVKHSPTTAMLLSIIPGGGQIYNKKYWKLPIVYGCLAASGYFLYSSADKMISFRDEYINRRDGNVELLTGNEVLEFDAHPAPEVIRIVFVDECAQGIGRLSVQKYVQLDKF